VPRHGRSGFRQNDVLHVFDFKAPRDNSLLKCTFNERLIEMKGQKMAKVCWNERPRVTERTN
jgi:hypothetical protein